MVKNIVFGYFNFARLLWPTEALFERFRNYYETVTSPVAQMADIGFKVVLLERLNQKWKQKHF